MSQSPIEYSESLRIGSVEFVSPDQIKVLLEIDAPDSVSLNTGTPRAFPRVNSYVLIPSDKGYMVGQVEWLTIEKSDYPKRRGMKDFGLVDLPYPLRKMSLNPLGTLHKDVPDGEENEDKDEIYQFKRGADTFPTVGDSVLIPTENQLRSIVESGDNRRVKIGNSPLAGNAEVKVDPDRLFGRHLAVLGNTGSGKSCSVAGLIRWSIEAAKEVKDKPNTRFIVLDPNGEYSKAFNNKEKSYLQPKIFQVNSSTPLKVPTWLWNTAEWVSFTKATDRSQRPLLQQALRQRRNARKPGTDHSPTLDLLDYLHGAKNNIQNQVSINAPFKNTSERDYWGFIEILNVTKSSIGWFQSQEKQFSELLSPLYNIIEDLINNKCKNDRNFHKPFEYQYIKELQNQLEEIIQFLDSEGKFVLPVDEDTPIRFSTDDIIQDLKFLARNQGNPQWHDSFLSRIDTLLNDARMNNIINDNDEHIPYSRWLNDYFGGNDEEQGVLTIIDLSLVPNEIIHIITASIARILFEALQRYRKNNENNKVLPTVLVMEEAHTFIKRYNESNEEQDTASVCCRVFERIAREGRKFGLGLVLSSQRPSELSPTVFSQCNNFLLHRISNDRDQDLVQRFVPDNLKGLFRELPSLPSQNAILLGWASELPTLVRINDLPENQRPQSEDPDFWDVWTGQKERNVNWKEIADDWQKAAKQTDRSESNNQDKESPKKNNTNEDEEADDLPF